MPAYRTSLTEKNIKVLPEINLHFQKQAPTSSYKSQHCARPTNRSTITCQKLELSLQNDANVIIKC